MRKKCIFLLVLSVVLILSLTGEVRIDSEAGNGVADTTTESVNTTTKSINTTTAAVDVLEVSEDSAALDIDETYISDEAYDACVEYGAEYDLSPELLMAIIERESSGDPAATNGNCQGLMQVSSYWHADRMERLGCTDLYDTKQNIHVGADYIAELFEQYENIYLVLMMYNMEHDTAQALYDTGVYSEYAVDIVGRMDELETLHKTK